MTKQLAWTWLVAAVALLIIGILSRFVPNPHGLTDRFFVQQDLPVLLAIAAAAAALRMVPGLAPWLTSMFAALARTPGFRALEAFGRRPGAVPVVAVIVAAIAAVGVWLVCDGYPLSRDEVMATFGAAIHAHGQLLASVPAAWRAYVPALEPEFLFSTADGGLWAAGYLPVNAALRALGGLVGAQGLVEPALAAVSILAVYGVSRRLWPERRSTAIAAVVLLATSSQLLITAMMPYAMTAHLAFNLVWLWLFLRGGRLGHGGALVVGFLACGLHQLVFHPLFVAPFVLQAWLDRRWRIAGLYTFAYGLICLFWIEYWPLAVSWSSVAANAGVAAAGHAAAVAPATNGAIGGFVAHVLALLASFDLGSFTLMAKNLLRFVVWQNPLLIALLGVGTVAAFRAGGNVRALLIGPVLTCLVILFVLPYQGHGWGYRYLHGFLGSAALLAARQWTLLVDGLPTSRRPAARAGFIAVAAVSVLVLAPWRALQVHGFIDPYARAYAAISHSPADVVVVDENQSWFTVDLVRNDPYLRNRPLVVMIDALTDPQIGELCTSHSLALFDVRSAARFGIWVLPPTPRDALEIARRRAVNSLHCGPNHAPVQLIG